ncbi:MAG: leucine-rich repeat protein [Treponemataceae bacterium]|nr:leucine-rich repeat protein [Treponemataceae bacterium]
MPEQKKELRFLPYPLFCGVLLVLMILAGCSSGSSEDSSMGESQVYPPPHKEYLYIELQEREITLNVGETYQLSVKINSNMANEDIALVWSSYNESVATVSTNGLVSAKSFGYTIIEVYAKNGWNRYTCNITVNDPNMLTSENAAEILGKDYKYKTTIVIPDGVTGIAEGVFDSYIFAESIIIPSGVTYIANRAFVSCGTLKNIVIPSSVTSIGNYAFYGCENLSDVYIEARESYEQIKFGDAWDNNEYSYPTCYGAELHIGETFDIPEEKMIILTQNNVGEILTDDYYSRGHIDIPENIGKIADYVFCKCTGLTSVTIPDSVTSIGDDAFSGCGSLTINYAGTKAEWEVLNVSLPAGTSVSCSDGEIEQGILNRQFLTIENNVVVSCSSAASGAISIPDSVTSIGDNAFSYCRGLTSISIPGSVTSIGSYAFYLCNNLNAVHIENLENWCGINFANSYDNPLYYAKHLYIDGEEVTDLIISDGTTTINDYAFYNCESLQTVTIPNSVMSVGCDAFYNCTDIDTVTYGGTLAQWCAIDNVGDFMKYAKVVSLSDIDDLKTATELIIPSGVSSIGSGAFYNCTGLTSVTIPSSVTSIGTDTFSFCKNIETVNVASREKWNEIKFSFSSSVKNIVFMDESKLNISVKFFDISKLDWIANGSVVTISAESGHSSYTWFVDMQKQSVTESVFSLDTADMKAGLYSVMVVIDGRYSATATVEILK